MQTKLSILVTIMSGLLIGTNVQASSGYCEKNIVKRSVSQFSIGEKNLAKLCNAYDRCNAKSAGSSRCDQQFAASANRQCHEKYASKTELGVCKFSVNTYSRLLQKYARVKTNN